MSSIPLPALDIQTPQQQDPIQKYAQLAQLKNMLQEQSLRQQLAPSQIAQAQAGAQSAGIDVQMKQAQLASQQAMIKAWSDPSFIKEVSGSDTSSANGMGFDPNAMTQGLIQRGVLPQEAMAITGQYVDRSQKMSETAKNNAAAASDQIGNYQKSVESISDRLASIMDMPVSKAGPAFQALKQDLAQNPPQGLSPQQAQALQGASLDHLPAFINLTELESKIADAHKKEADAQVAQQNVIPSSGTLSPAAQQSLQQDIAKETNPQVIAARAQGAAQSQIAVQKALYGGSPLASVPPQLVPAVTAAATKADQAYTQAQQAGNEMQSMVDLAKKGNKVAYAYSPVTGVLQINVAGQIKRMNMPEIESYGGAGSALDRIQGFLGKQASGKSIPDDVLNDMSSVSQMVTEGAKTKYEQDIAGLNSRYGSNFQPMNESGNAPTAAPNKSPSGAGKDLGAAPAGAKEGQTGKFNGVPSKIVNGRIVAQ